MIERPIPYSPDMVKARRAGQKTKTRRQLRVQPPEGFKASNGGFASSTHHLKDGNRDGFGWDLGRADNQQKFWPSMTESIFCPYGQPGDRLWVKEEHWLFGLWHVDGRTATGQVKWRFEADQSMGVRFDAPNGYVTGRSTTVQAWHKRIGMFMPRWASRGLDEVVSVRVERLQDISEADALAEGIVHEVRDPGLGRGGRPGYRWADNEYAGTAAHGYAMLWEAINGDGSWDVNPWVWVIEFKVITP